MPVEAVLYVEDLERMRSFYAGCFNLEAVAHDKDFVVLRSECLELTLVVVPDDVAGRVAVSQPPIRRAAVPLKLGLVVAGIKQARPVVGRFGGTVDDPSREWVFRGRRRCDAVDPEGNVIQLVETASEYPPV